MNIHDVVRAVPEATFYCCWCGTRKPVRSGYVEMSHRRKKCRACHDKRKETRHAPPP